MFQELKEWRNRVKGNTLYQWIEAFVVILPIAFVIRTWGYGLYQVPTGSMETTMLVGERFIADKFTLFFKQPVRGDIISFNNPNFSYSKHTVVHLIQQYVWGPDNWTKRVIGEPGDHVQGKIIDGTPVVFINGKQLDEPYLNKYPLLEIAYPVNAFNLVPRSYDPKYSYQEQPFYRMSTQEVRQGKNICQLLGRPDVLYPHTPLQSWQQGSDQYDVHLGSDEYWVMGDNRLGSYDCRAWGPLKSSLIHGKIKLCLWSIDSSSGWWIWDLVRHPISFWKMIRWNRCLKAI